MLGCVTEVFVAQAFPQKSAAVIVEKGAISELSMHDTGQTLLDAPRQRMIRPPPAGCKENCALAMLKIERGGGDG